MKVLLLMALGPLMACSPVKAIPRATLEPENATQAILVAKIEALESRIDQIDETRRRERIAVEKIEACWQDCNEGYPGDGDVGDRQACFDSCDRMKSDLPIGFGQGC